MKFYLLHLDRSGLSCSKGKQNANLRVAALRTGLQLTRCSTQLSSKIVSMRKQPIFCDAAISMEFLHLFLSCHFGGKPVVMLEVVGCFFRLQINSKQCNTVNNPLSYRGIP